MAETSTITPDEIQAQIVMIKGKRTKRHRPPSPSPSYSTTADYCSSSSLDHEDQDMANCLILLAQGREKAVESASSSVFVYQCKTCDRCFPSFQALGGHRASHKKPKNNVGFINSLQQQYHNNNTANVRLSLELSSGCRQLPSKVHECSICGAEFSSGQALGGHMRRHRALTTAAAAATANTPVLMMKKERRVLELDLNLPAPEVAVPFGGLPLLIQN